MEGVYSVGVYSVGGSLSEGRNFRTEEKGKGVTNFTTAQSLFAIDLCLINILQRSLLIDDNHSIIIVVVVVVFL